MNYFVANFKANINPHEARDWFNKFSFYTDGDEVVICPSFVTLPFFVSNKKDGIKIGSQDVSKYADGAHTGEVTVRMLEDVADYSIVGHSERQKYFNETLDDVALKLSLLSPSKLKVILCLNNDQELQTLMTNSLWNQIDLEKLVLVYEPSTAISGGKDFHPDSKENIEEMVGKIKQLVNRPVLYGGSVTEENIAELIPNNVSGVLVGQKSLDPAVFAKLIENFPRS